MRSIDKKKRDGLPPDGWRLLEHAVTGPLGWKWWSNGKSRFGGEYENALYEFKWKKDGEN